MKQDNFLYSLYWTYKNFHYYLKGIPCTIPHMTEKELSLFRSTLTNTKYLLEFGSGGSTYYAIKNGITVFSIESSLSFIKIMKKSSLIKRAIKNNKLLYYHADLGITKEWSIPLDENKDGYLYWGRPIDTIPYLKNKISSYWGNIDTAFIDGRYRIACTLNILYRLPKINKIIFHDFSSNKEYKVIENFCTLIKMNDSLAIFEPQKNLDFAKIKIFLDKYRYNYE